MVLSCSKSPLPESPIGVVSTWSNGRCDALQALSYIDDFSSPNNLPRRTGRFTFVLKWGRKCVGDGVCSISESVASIGCSLRQYSETIAQPVTFALRNSGVTAQAGRNRIRCVASGLRVLSGSK